METVLKAIADWIKGILTAGIMSNLSGLFDDVNTQVGNIAQQVGTKPSSFEPRVFAMIEALSRNVVLPIAGIILTFIACYELIEMITQHNNMAQFEPALIMRWIFKTAVSVWLISNTFDIVIKQDRRDEIMELQQEIAFEKSEAMKGRTLEVMIEGKVADENAYVGRTYMDSPNVDGLIFVNTGLSLMSGDFLKVRVTGASEYDLIGEAVNEFTE